MSINNWDKILNLAGVKKTSNEDSLLTEQYSKVDSKIQNIKNKIDAKLKQISKRKSLGKLDQRTASLEGKLKVLQVKLQNHIKNKSTAIMDSEKYMRELENIEKSLTSNNDTQLEKSVDNVTTTLKKDEVAPQIKAESLTPDIYVERGTVFIRGNTTEIVLDKLGSFYYIYEIDKGDYLPTQDKSKAMPFDEGMISREILKGTIKPTKETYRISASARTNSKLLKASTGLNFKSMTPQQASNFVDKIVNDKIYIKLKGEEDYPFLIVKTSDGQYLFKGATGKQSTTPLTKEDLVDGFVKGQLFERFFVVKGNILLENESKKITLLIEEGDLLKSVNEFKPDTTPTKSGGESVTNSVEQLDKLGTVHNSEKYTLGVLQAKLAALGYWQSGRPLSFTKDDYTKSVVRDFLQKNPNKSLKDLVSIDGYTDISNFKPSGDKPVATSASEVKSYLTGVSPTKTTSPSDNSVSVKAGVKSSDTKDSKSKSSKTETPEILEGYKRGTYGYEVIKPLYESGFRGYNGNFIVSSSVIEGGLVSMLRDIEFEDKWSLMDLEELKDIMDNDNFKMLYEKVFLVEKGNSIKTLQSFFLNDVFERVFGNNYLFKQGTFLNDKKLYHERFNFSKNISEQRIRLFISQVNAIGNIYKSNKEYDSFLEKNVKVDMLELKIDNIEEFNTKIKNIKLPTPKIK